MFKPQQILQHKYRLIRQLGRTAIGHQTWLAKDLKIGDKVTIKLLAFNPQSSWEELKLFEREAKILQALNHPKIPQYKDYFDLDRNIGQGIPWFALVQEYIPGKSLQELLDSGYHFDIKQTRNIAEEILKILIYLHELNPPILHRDIKPSNLILGEDKQIYLIDFGAVQDRASVTGVTFTVVGTSGYAPLEQFWGRAVAASDLYALGATLIHLLTGISPGELPHKNYHIQFRDRVSLKSYFIDWIEKITDIAVENRFDSAREALTGLTFEQKITEKKSQAIANFQLNRPHDCKIKIEGFHPEDNLIITLPSFVKTQLFDREIQNPIPILLGASALLFGLITIGLISLFWLILIISLMPISIYLSILQDISTKLTFTRDSIEIRHKRFFTTVERHKIYCDRKPQISLYFDKIAKLYQLNLSCADKEYYIGRGLRQDECIWLIQEIEAWYERHNKMYGVVY